MQQVFDSKGRPIAGLTATQTPAPTPAWRSPWVIGWLVLVGSVLAINGAMVYLAIKTNPGLVVDDYYDRGQHYEQTLVSNLAKDPGWTMRAELPTDIKAGETRVVRFNLVDKAGQPVAVDGVTFYAYRPSDVTRDFSLPMTLEGPGRYVVQASFSVFGVWDTVFAARQGGDEYTHGQRLMVGRP
jgi:nitrogen fixation protein FixH